MNGLISPWVSSFMPTGKVSALVPLVVEEEEYQDYALRLQQKYGFSLITHSEEIPSAAESFLLLDSAGLSLVSAVNPKERIQADFIGGRSGYRLATAAHTAQPILKAIGCTKEKRYLRVLDATAGLGVDGMIMASAGCRVLLLESSAVMAAMLEDGLERVLRQPEENSELRTIVTDRVNLLQADSMDYLQNVTGREFEVIYLDPMFPGRKKASKVKKEMQLTRSITDWTDNAGELLEAALQTPVRRVVLKRPLKAPLIREDYSMQIKGKSIRFDVFVR